MRVLAPSSLSGVNHVQEADLRSIPPDRLSFVPRRLCCSNADTDKHTNPAIAQAHCYGESISYTDTRPNTHSRSDT